MPSLKAGAVPANWEDLVEDSRHNSVYGFYDITKTWFEGQFDPSGTDSHQFAAASANHDNDHSAAPHMSNHTVAPPNKANGNDSSVAQQTKHHIHLATNHITSSTLLSPPACRMVIYSPIHLPLKIISHILMKKLTVYQMS